MKHGHVAWNAESTYSFDMHEQGAWIENEMQLRHVARTRSIGYAAYTGKQHGHAAEPAHGYSACTCCMHKQHGHTAEAFIRGI